MAANFYVTQSPLTLMDGTKITKRTLYMSAPLLRVMSDAEVRAVLGHEFSHFTGRDTLYGSQVAPAYRSLQHGMDEMRANMDQNQLRRGGIRHTDNRDRAVHIGVSDCRPSLVTEQGIAL